MEKTLKQKREQRQEEERIARTILEQIKANDVYALMAYGAKNFVAHNANDKKLGGVQFDVNGLNFKGRVTIELVFDDTYTITFGKVINCEWKEVKKVEGVYCDMLVGILDFIEKKEHNYGA